MSPHARLGLLALRALTAVLPFQPPAGLDPAFAVEACSGDAAAADTAAVSSMVDAYYDSFAEADDANTFWWSARRADMIPWMHRRVAGRMRDRSTRHFRVVAPGDGGAVASWGRWDVPDGYEDVFGAWPTAGARQGLLGGGGKAVESAVAEGGPVQCPPGTDSRLCNSFFDKLHEKLDKFNAKEMLVLDLLCTSPSYQKRGAAKALLEPMLELADQAKLRTYLEATDAGRPVYEKLGFKAVDDVTWDVAGLTGRRGAKDLHMTIMIRQPKR